MTPYATFTIVNLGLDDLENDLGDMRVQGYPAKSGSTLGDVAVILNYEYQIGPDDNTVFTPDPAVVTFVVSAMNVEAAKTFRNQTIAVYTHDDVLDSDTPDGEDTYTVIPNCATGQYTTDGRCSEAFGYDEDGDGTFDWITVQAEVTHL